MGKYNILAWIDKDETIHVVLDGADLEATTALYEEAYPELMEKTGTSTSVSYTHLDVYKRQGP